MAVDYFLKVDGVEGESADSKHQKEIDVLSFAWGVSQTAGSGGGGAAAGKVVLNDFAIMKFVDTATPQLMQEVCTGRHIAEANFTARKAGDRPLEFLKIKFTDVLISNVSPGGSQGDLLPTEHVSFSFGQATITVFQQDETGSLGKQETTTCGGSR